MTLPKISLPQINLLNLSALYFVLGIVWMKLDPAAFLCRPELWLDTWIYLGYAEFGNLHYLNFPDTYYGSRLSYILPVYFFKNLVGIEMALKIFKFSIFLGSVLAVWYIGKKIKGSFEGFLASLVLFFNPFYYTEFFYDHPTGFGIAFVLISIAFYLKEKIWATYCSGLFYCLAIHSNLFFSLFGIFPILFLFFQKKSLSKNGVRLGIFFSACLLGTILFGIAGHFLGAGFFFYLPSIQYGGTWNNWVHSRIWKAQGWGWVLKNQFTFLPIVGLFALVVGLFQQFIGRKEFETNKVLIFLVGSTGIYFIYSFLHIVVGSAFLNTPYYLIHLAPFAALACFICGYEKSCMRPNLILATAIAVFSFIWAIVLKQKDLTHYVLSSVIFILLISLFPQQKKTPVLVSLYFLLTVLSLLPNVPYSDVPDKQKSEFLRDSLKLAHKVYALNENNRPLFWVEADAIKNNAHVKTVALLSLFLYGPSTFSIDFPNFEKSLFGKSDFEILKAQQRLTILCKNHDLLKSAVDSLNKKTGKSFVVKQEHPIFLDNQKFYLIQLKNK